MAKWQELAGRMMAAERRRVSEEKAHRQAEAAAKVASLRSQATRDRLGAAEKEVAELKSQLKEAMAQEGATPAGAASGLPSSAPSAESSSVPMAMAMPAAESSDRPRRGRRTGGDESLGGTAT